MCESWSEVDASFPSIVPAATATASRQTADREPGSSKQERSLTNWSLRPPAPAHPRTGQKPLASRRELAGGSTETSRGEGMCNFLSKTSAAAHFFGLLTSATSWPCHQQHKN